MISYLTVHVPAGYTENDNKVNLTVFVEDINHSKTVGASKEFTILSPSDSDGWLNDISSENGTLSLLLAKNDKQRVVDYIATVGSFFDFNSADFEGIRERRSDNENENIRVEFDDTGDV